MTTAPQTETAQDRLARARAALGDAERRASRWGGRIDRTALRPPGGLGGPTGLVPAPSSRASSAPVALSATAPSVAEDPVAEAAGERLAVPAPLAPLIPHGTLRAGSSLAVTGGAGTSLLLALAAAAAGEDAWCAIAGMPDLGLRAALDAGLDPCRLAIVPDAAEQAVALDEAELGPERKVALVLGAEGHGLTDATLRAVDQHVIIPMSGGVDSLNVAAASAVVFWQRRVAVRPR